MTATIPGSQEDDDVRRDRDVGGFHKASATAAPAPAATANNAAAVQVIW